MPHLQRATRTAAAALFCALLTTPLGSQTVEHGYDLSHLVHFQIGDMYFAPGDGIEIKEVRGTADTLRRGGLYEVKGIYKLASHAAATLAASVTTSENGGKGQWMDVQRTSIERGEGQFTLFFYMETSGFPHISLYPTDNGESFTGVYFGTGASVMPVKQH
jgi:hypothetical protein